MGRWDFLWFDWGLVFELRWIDPRSYKIGFTFIIRRANRAVQKMRLESPSKVGWFVSCLRVFGVVFSAVFWRLVSLKERKVQSR